MRSKTWNRLFLMNVKCMHNANKGNTDLKAIIKHCVQCAQIIGII